MLLPTCRLMRPLTRVEEAMGSVPCEVCPELEARAGADCPAGDFPDFCVADVCATFDLGVWVNATKEAYEWSEEIRIWCATTGHTEYIIYRKRLPLA
jgi:hypothetical protein